MSETNQNTRKDLGPVSAYALAVANGYTGTEQEFAEYLSTAAQKAAQTVTKAGEAAASALKAEGYAVGQQNGTDVQEGSPYYENNAEYFSQQAAAKLAEVNTAGATQIAAIQTKGEETLESIPDDYTELSGNVDLLNNAIGYVGGEQSVNIEIDITSYRNENHYWNSEAETASLTSYNNYCSYDPITIVPGEIYSVYIFRQSSAKQHAVLLVDENLSIISSYGHGTGSTDGFETYNFTVPNDATKMLLTTANVKTAPVVTKTISRGILNSVPDLIERVDDLETESETVNSQISEITTAIGYTETEDITIDISSLKNENHFWNSETTTAVLSTYNDYCSYDAISVVAGDSYRVSIHIMSSKKQHAVLLTSDDLTIISSYGHGDGSHTPDEIFEITIPDGVTKMLLTTRNTTIPTVKKLGSSIQLNSVPALIEISKPLKGKTVAIIGDSISTNGNTGDDPNVPEITITEDDVGVELSAYLTYYDVQAGLSLGEHTYTSSEIGTEVTFTPVAGDVGKKIGLPNNYNPNSTTVWWEIMQEVFGNNTVPVCWSGASITSHEASSNSYKTSYAWHPAQIRKCGIRIPGTMQRTAPDMIIIYRGTNDFSHSSYAKLTEGYFDRTNWQYPENDTVTGGFGYLEGIALTIKKLREAYPNAQIYLCTMNVFKRVNYAHFPTNNGQNTLPEFNNAIRKAADFFGCGLIEFDKDGITFENCYSGGYITDSATTPTHPSDKGHAVMGRKAIVDIRAQYNKLG